ncbi:helicase DnaB [Halobacillus fulvus]|nr:helicase DnaB [Halobacillus fulvus]
MSHSIGKLLPVDGFRLTKRGELPKGAHRSLTHLYQPIIGRLAVSLYQTLVSEYEIVQSDDVQTHHTLMSYLSAPLDHIYEARQKLEAIGLLRTYVTDGEQHTEYVYKLYPPFSPEAFFTDNMLSLLLQHEIGKDKFEKLQSRLLKPEIPLDAYQEVTSTFDEVFHPVMDGEIPAGRQTEQWGPTVEESRIDFNWLHQSLKQRMYASDKVLTGSNKKLIIQLASLYNLTSLEVEKALTWAIDEKNELVVEEFKAACHDFIKEKPSPKQNKELDRREKMQTTEDIPQTKMDQLAARFEQISPRELLEDLSSGNYAAEQDLKVVRDVMTEQGLAPGVMNVLIHYVMLKTDKKLSKPYVEKIASHWARKNVKTVKQAMNLAKAEHQKYLQWGQQKSYRPKNNQDEVLPAWFNQQKKRPAKKEQSENDVETDDLAKLLNDLTNK